MTDKEDNSLEAVLIRIFEGFELLEKGELDKETLLRREPCSFCPYKEEEQCTRTGQ